MTYSAAVITATLTLETWASPVTLVLDYDSAAPFAAEMAVLNTTQPGTVVLETWAAPATVVLDYDSAAPPAAETAVLQTT